MPVEYVQGNSPILLALPYTGTNMHRSIVQRLASEEAFFAMPDRWLDRLMTGLFADLNLVRANFHRFLSDVDYLLPKDDLEPVRGMIGVVPLLDGEGQTVWHEPPSKKEAASWRAMYYAPYHAAVGAQLAQIRARHGHAILVNCRAQTGQAIDQEGDNPVDIGLSTYMGASCEIGLSTSLLALLRSSEGFTATLNTRSAAGWTTRHYGRPRTGIHAMDLVLNETWYLAEAPENGYYDGAKAAALRDLLTAAFGYMAKWRPA